MIPRRITALTCPQSILDRSVDALFGVPLDCNPALTVVNIVSSEAIWTPFGGVDPDEGNWWVTIDCREGDQEICCRCSYAAKDSEK